MTAIIEPEAPEAELRQAREPVRTTDGSRLWGGLTLPGAVWLIVFFVVPFYAVAAVAFGTTDAVFLTAVPEWNPLQWNFEGASDTLADIFGGAIGPVYLRTFLYVGLALAACIAVGYPVAYYIARHARRTRTVLLAAMILPFWVNYLLRMLAWIGLLQPEGFVNDVLTAVGIFSAPRAWLNGSPFVVVLGLVYGYLPFFILPLYAGLAGIDTRLGEAARDLGARPHQVFRRVTWPLSRTAVVAASVITVLPMFGDYYTNTLLSGSPRTEMIGNQIEFFVLESRQPQKGAFLVLTLSAVLAVLMSWYLWTTARAQRMAQR
jgi:spermidine/putrescine transport system permease protein